MKNKEEIRSWKSYLTCWGASLVVGIISFWDNDFIFDRFLLAYICSMFVMFNGLIMMFFITFPLIFDKIGLRKLFKRTNWIPALIDLLLIIFALVHIYQTSLHLFKFSVALVPAVMLTLLVSINIRWFFPPYNR